MTNRQPQLDELFVPADEATDQDEISRLVDAYTELLAACKFSLSVHQAQGLYEMSERMAVKKLELAIANAEKLQ